MQRFSEGVSKGNSNHLNGVPEDGESGYKEGISNM